jgi:hypothetical protein
MTESKVIFKKDFLNVTELGTSIRISVYPDKKDDTKARLAVKDKDKLIFSMDVGMFVDIVPFIVEHLYFHARLGETSPPTMTAVPSSNFRIVKTKDKGGTVHTRVCIVPPSKLVPLDVSDDDYQK